MEIVPATAKLILDIDGVSLLKKIEYAARLSHRSEDLMKEDSYLRFIKAVVVDHGDWSVTEHASASVEYVGTRDFTHQLVRHRLFGYTQESQRFVNYNKKFGLSFIKPEGLDEESEVEFLIYLHKAEAAYKYLIDHGCKPEEARSILPNCTVSKIMQTGNLRNFRHLFLMRTTRETQKGTRDIIIPLLEEFQKNIPILYDDIIPMARQVDNLGKPR